MSDLGSGLMLMAIGMGTVFLFLVLLIGATELLHKFAGQPNVDPTAAARTTASRSTRHPQPLVTAVATNSDDATLAAVITAAITAYRNDPDR